MRPDRDEVVPLAATVNRTVMLPEPDVSCVVIHGNSDGTRAVHVHPVPLTSVHDTEPVPPPKGMLMSREVVSRYSQFGVPAACSTRTSRPAMRRIPTRLVVVVLACTSKVAGEEGLPHASMPGTGERCVIQEARLSAVHVHSRRGSTTLALNVPPEAGAEIDRGETLKSQLLGRTPPHRPGAMGVEPADPTTVLTAPSRLPQVLAGGPDAPHEMLEVVSVPAKGREATHPFFSHRSDPRKSPLDGRPTSSPVTVPVRPSAAS